MKKSSLIALCLACTVTAQAKDYVITNYGAIADTTQLSTKAIQQAIEGTKLYRFRKDGFTLYIYGVCSSCQRRISLQRNSQKQQ